MLGGEFPFPLGIVQKIWGESLERTKLMNRERISDRQWAVLT